MSVRLAANGAQSGRVAPKVQMVFAAHEVVAARVPSQPELDGQDVNDALWFDDAVEDPVGPHRNLAHVVTPSL
jgi:hypothetical protein